MAEQIRESPDDDDDESADDIPTIAMTAADMIAAQRNDDEAEMSLLGHAISVVRSHMPGVIHMEEASFKDQGIFPTIDSLDDDMKGPFKRLLINAMNFAAKCFEIDEDPDSPDEGDRNAGRRSIEWRG